MSVIINNGLYTLDVGTYYLQLTVVYKINIKHNIHNIEHTHIII